MNRQNPTATLQGLIIAVLWIVAAWALLALCPLITNAQTTLPAPRNVRPSTSRRILVSFPDHKLALLEDGRVVKLYNVAVGAPVSPSPAGEFRIVQRLENPTYYRPGVVIGPGTANPLGSRWMGLDLKGLGIHGTNQPASIGKDASHGCIRLRNRDMEDLFARVRVGDRVTLLAERDEVTAQIFGGPRLPTVDVAQLMPNEKSEPDPDGARGDK